jgi:protease-4
MRDFFKTVFATLVGLILFVTLGVAGLTALLVVIVSSSQETGPSVENNSILTFDLSQDITDSSSAVAPSEVIGEALSGGSHNRSIALRSVLESLKNAATDPRIAGLYLSGTIDPSGSGSGPATLQEVRQALQHFRQSGKPIFAYDGADWAERDYYLASIANHIVLNPNAALEINGFSMETTFFAGALQKYGIGMQPVRVGRYKSAVEPFIRTNNSPAAREQTQQLLSDLWNEFLTTAANSRNLTPQKLQAIADQQGVVLPEQAKSDGLVDKIAYEDELTADLKQVTGEGAQDDSFRQISLANYSQAIEQKKGSSSSNQIALVYAEGDIVSGAGGAGKIGGDTLAERLQELRKDDQVKAVVLRVNSPGGSATASATIAREMALTRQQKPVIVSMGSYAASGGYEIATNASRIFASPNTITGSIGVFGLLPNVQKIANDNGITWDVVKTGHFADINTISRPKTPQELAVTQRVVDRLYDQFLGTVAQSRDLPRQRVDQIAQGRVWSGLEAKKIGLVDELGGLENAIQAAAKEAKLGNDWTLEEYPKSRSFKVQVLEKLFSSRLAHAAAPQDPLSLELRKLQGDLDILRSMNDPLGAYSRLPFNPWID